MDFQHHRCRFESPRRNALPPGPELCRAGGADAGLHAQPGSSLAMRGPAPVTGRNAADARFLVVAEGSARAGVVTFAVVPLRIHCRARNEIRLDANFLRGHFGSQLRAADRELYERFFVPKRLEGPSGLRDAPRPFVFRVREASIMPGDRFDFGFNLFDPRESVDSIVRAFGPDVEHVNRSGILELALERTTALSRVRINFL